MWEFDSHLNIISSGKVRQMQVWSRTTTGNIKEWTLTEDFQKENPPKIGVGCWSCIESFKKNFPHFNRAD